MLIKLFCLKIVTSHVPWSTLFCTYMQNTYLHTTVWTQMHIMTHFKFHFFILFLCKLGCWHKNFGNLMFTSTVKCLDVAVIIVAGRTGCYVQQERHVWKTGGFLCASVSVCEYLNFFLPVSPPHSPSLGHAQCEADLFRQRGPTPV